MFKTKDISNLLFNGVNGSQCWFVIVSRNAFKLLKVPQRSIKDVSLLRSASDLKFQVLKKTQQFGTDNVDNYGNEISKYICLFEGFQIDWYKYWRTLKVQI